MRRWIGTVAIVSLLVVGIAVIYQEAQAKVWLCDGAESWCANPCFGTFYYLYCEPYDLNGNGLIDCLFCCDVGGSPNWPCGWLPGSHNCAWCVL